MAIAFTGAEIAQITPEIRAEMVALGTPVGAIPTIQQQAIPGTAVIPAQQALTPYEQWVAEGSPTTELAIGMGWIPIAIGAVGALAGWLFGDVGEDVVSAATAPLGGGTGTSVAVPAAVGAVAGVGGVPLVGPGVAEPSHTIVKKRWETRVYSNTLGYVKLNFYQLTDGRVMMYHNTLKYWKIWKPKKNIVLSSDPRMSNLRKLDRVYKRTQKMLKKFVPKTPRVTSRQAPSRYLSPAEKKMLSAGH